jgi:hypothetical protein
MIDASGKCLCGAVRFHAKGVDPEVHACHCGMCRRWGAGGPFLGASVKEVTFESTDQLARYASSDWAERGYCKRCGSSLFYFYAPKKLYTFTIGAFDDATPFRVAKEIFIDHKPEAYALAGDRPRLTEREVMKDAGF